MAKCIHACFYRVNIIIQGNLPYSSVIYYKIYAPKREHFNETESQYGETNECNKNNTARLKTNNADLVVKYCAITNDSASYLNNNII